MQRFRETGEYLRASDSLIDPRASAMVGLRVPVCVSLGDAFTRGTICRLLTLMRVSATNVDNAWTLLQQLQSAAPHIVLLDWRLHGLDLDSFLEHAARDGERMRRHAYVVVPSPGDAPSAALAAIPRTLSVSVLLDPLDIGQLLCAVTQEERRVHLRQARHWQVEHLVTDKLGDNMP
jgi:CheY-like chemotaxis protein